MIWRDHENLAALFLQMVLTDDYQSEPSTRQWARIWLDTSNFLTQASCMLYYIRDHTTPTCLCTTYNFLTNAMVVIFDMVIIVKMVIMVVIIIMVVMAVGVGDTASFKKMNIFIE